MSDLRAGNESLSDEHKTNLKAVAEMVGPDSLRYGQFLSLLNELEETQAQLAQQTKAIEAVRTQAEKIVNDPRYNPMMRNQAAATLRVLTDALDDAQASTEGGGDD